MKETNSLFGIVSSFCASLPSVTLGDITWLEYITLSMKGTHLRKLALGLRKAVLRTFI